MSVRNERSRATREDIAFSAWHKRAERSEAIKRGPLLLAGGVVALLVIAAIHVGQGSSSVGLGGFLDALLGSAPENVRDVVFGSRVPRLLAGLVAGAGLAIAGNLLQTVTRNPLAAPDTLAVNAGAYLAAVVAAIAGVELGILPAGGMAFLGGLAAAAIVYLLAAGVGATPTRLLLAGVAVTLFLASLTAVLLLMYEQQTSGMFLWGQGSLVQSGNDRWLTMLPVVVLVLLIGVVFARTFDVIAQGDDTARSVGVPVGWVRLGGVLLAVLAAAAAVTVCGPIGFVGLVAPHLVRLACQKIQAPRRHRWMLPTTAIWGATLLIAADVLARLLTSLAGGPGLGSELPAGVVTALAGAPFFLWLARRERAGAGTASSAASGAAHRRFLPYGWIVLISAGVLVFVALWSLRLGDETVAWGDVIAALTGGQTDLVSLILDYRAPRVVVAIIAGGALAASGLVLQGVVRNPLAEPALLGVTGGAGIGALLVLFVFPAAVVLLPVGAFIGATLAFALTYVVAWRRGIVPERLVLVGVGVSAMTAAVVSYLVTAHHLQMSQALTWLSGSIYARDWDDVLVLLWIPVILLPLAWVGGRQLDVLALGDDPSRAIGVRLEPTRLVLLGLAVALAAGSVAVVGTIGFVGLVAPHAARSVVAGKHRRLLVVSVFFGALLVLIADTVGRTVLAPKQLPAGLITALIGTPYFAYRLWRTRNRRV